MSKNIKIAALGIAAFATAAAPMMAMAAENDSRPIQIVDKLAITIDKVCTFARLETSSDDGHPAVTGGGTWTSADGTDTLAYTIVAGNANAEIGHSKFIVKCNDTAGYKLSLAATDLTANDGADTIAFAASEPVATASTWGIKQLLPTGASWLTEDATIDTEDGALENAGKTFEFQYGVSAEDGQAAGTYNGQVTYTLAKIQQFIETLYSKIAAFTVAILVS